jgi:hypothetical protein
MDDPGVLDHALGSALDIEVVTYDEIVELESRRLRLLQMLIDLLG